MPLDKLIFVAEIPEIITNPDYAGINDGQIELIKCFNVHYVATLFDVKQSKIESYCKSGRIKKLDKSEVCLHN